MRTLLIVCVLLTLCVVQSQDINPSLIESAANLNVEAESKAAQEIASFLADSAMQSMEHEVALQKPTVPIIARANILPRLPLDSLTGLTKVLLHEPRASAGGISEDEELARLELEYEGQSNGILKKPASTRRLSPKERREKRQKDAKKALRAEIGQLENLVNQGRDLASMIPEKERRIKYLQDQHRANSDEKVKKPQLKMKAKSKKVQKAVKKLHRTHKAHKAAKKAAKKARKAAKKAAKKQRKAEKRVKKAAKKAAKAAKKAGKKAPKGAKKAKKIAPVKPTAAALKATLLQLKTLSRTVRGFYNYINAKENKKAGKKSTKKASKKTTKLQKAGAKARFARLHADTESDSEVDNESEQESEMESESESDSEVDAESEAESAIEAAAETEAEVDNTLDASADPDVFVEIEDVKME